MSELVALHRASVVNHQGSALTDHLRRRRTMRQRSVFAHLHAGAPAKTDLGIRGGDQRADIALRHARLHRLVHGAIHHPGRLVGQLHQLELVRRFRHAAAGGDRGRAHHLQRRRSLRHAIAEDECHPLFHAQRARRNAAVLEPLHDQPVGIFVFLPDPDVGLAVERPLAELLPQPFLFERGCDQEGIALGGKHQRAQTLAVPPTDIGEVEQRAAADHEDGVELVGGHQLARALDALPALVRRDRAGLVAHRLERLDGRRLRGCLLTNGGQRQDRMFLRRLRPTSELRGEKP